ncbi:MAG: two pore domain potassium channel family protein [Deltaproteobacteria bacterium]|nr:two pore domain potassium channel family protein [Deltaproteobacteria bacterium]
MTITTVGYGDIVPLTAIGRLIGFGIMFSGLVQLTAALSIALS